MDRAPQKEGSPLWNAQPIIWGPTRPFSPHRFSQAAQSRNCIVQFVGNGLWGKQWLRDCSMLTYPGRYRKGKRASCRATPNWNALPFITMIHLGNVRIVCWLKLVSVDLAFPQITGSPLIESCPVGPPSLHYGNAIYYDDLRVL